MMNQGERLYREIKELASMQSDLKSEIMGLKGRLAMENREMTIVEKDRAYVQAQLDYMKDVMDSLKAQEEFLNVTREANNKYHLWHLYLKKYVEEMTPNEQEKESTFNQLYAHYEMLREKYEQRPEYSQIIEAVNTGKNLDQMINEKRDELMKLDTEREF